MSARCEFMEYHRPHRYRTSRGEPRDCEGLAPPVGTSDLAGAWDQGCVAGFSGRDATENPYRGCPTTKGERR